MPRVTAIVDGHVHIHACYDIDHLLDHAWKNLNRAVPVSTGAREFYLLMTETADDHYFSSLRAAASSGVNGKLRLKRWRATATSTRQCRSRPRASIGSTMCTPRRCRRPIPVRVPEQGVSLAEPST